MTRNKPDKAKIVILISGRGSNMRAIIDACDRGEVLAEVVLVVSNNEAAAGLDYARQRNIDVFCLSHKAFSSRDEFDQAIAEHIKSYAPDLICLAGFMRILGAEFVQQFEGKIINIHPSLLPKYKGLHTHKRALDAGDQKAGCSVHYVTAELDDGEVIAQTQVPILPDDDEQALATRVLAVEHETYLRAIQSVLNATSS